MNVSITAISDQAHPACGQSGLFAKRHLAPDSFILLYLGVIHGQEDADPTSDYDLSLDRELNVGIDASKSGNEARFINDYRGVTQRGPNAEFRDVWVEPRHGKYERRMAVFVLSSGKSGKRAAGIKKGEEILVSYGKGFWSERQYTADEVP
jgi:SET domain-containing protein